MLRVGIDPEKLYRATFICQNGLCCCNMALICIRLFRKNLGNLRDVFGQMVYRPPWQKISRTPMLKRLHLHFLHSMYLQDVTRWILLGGQNESAWNTWINFLRVTAVFTACPVTSRSNRSGLCQLLSAYTFFYMREKVVLYCQRSQKYSSFFDAACIT